MQDKHTFLTAAWRRLAMLNYAVPPDILYPHVPAGTELDMDPKGSCYLSVVAFMFLDTRVLGMKIPGHVNFEEANLRFYVKRRVNHTETRRGVVFIREIVPRPAIAWVANRIYRENYACRKMSHHWASGETSYSWKNRGGNDWVNITLQHDNDPKAIAPGSHAEFITEHYWGYARVNEHQSMEYEVRHPRWKTYDIHNFRINGDFVREYGTVFGNFMQGKPQSVILAEGSEITVQRGAALSGGN